MAGEAGADAGVTEESTTIEKQEIILKNFSNIILFTLLSFAIIPGVVAQKKVSELTILYDYALVSGAKGAQNNSSLNPTTLTIYLKGNLCRSEMASALFFSTTFYDAKTGSATILKEVSGQKLLIRMAAEDLQEKNRRYEGLMYINEPETKIIAGYKCMKAVAKTKDGLTITVYYTKDLIPDNKDYEPQFKNLEGLPLEYELTNGNLKIKYTLSAINLNPIPESKFDIPKSGYREMTYEESKKLHVTN
jgi:GLPGLI family protein